MSEVPVAAICQERLDRWKARLIENDSTPVVLIGVGHGRKLGQCIVTTIEEIDQDEIKLFLLNAIDMLDKQ